MTSCFTFTTKKAVKRLSTLVILTSYLLQFGFPVDTAGAQDMRVQSLPLDEFTTPAFDCLSRPIISRFETSNNILNSRCLGFSSTLAALWTLARYQRASAIAKNPSPLVLMAKNKLEQFLTTENLASVKAEIQASPFPNIESLTWILRLDLELHQLRILTSGKSRIALRTLAHVALGKLRNHVLGLKEPNRYPNFFNSGWVMWNMLSWSYILGRQGDIEMLKARGRELFAQMSACKTEEPYAGPASLSPCFIEITFLLNCYARDEIIKMLEERFPDPYVLVRRSAAGQFGFSPSLVLATIGIQNLVSADNPWLTVHMVNMRKTLEGLPLWRERLELSHWLAPLSVMAITSELN